MEKTKFDMAMEFIEGAKEITDRYADMVFKVLGLAEEAMRDTRGVRGQEQESQALVPVATPPLVVVDPALPAQQQVVMVLPPEPEPALVQQEPLVPLPLEPKAEPVVFVEPAPVAEIAPATARNRCSSAVQGETILSRVWFPHGKMRVCTLCANRFTSIGKIMAHRTDCAERNRTNCTKCNLFRCSNYRGLSNHKRSCGAHKILDLRIRQKRVELAGSQEVANTMDWPAYARRYYATYEITPTSLVMQRATPVPDTPEDLFEDMLRNTEPHPPGQRR
ncbi:uncharacterized protein LOC111518650 [Drosophila willistoni]|uniref:uncharacterized protein LOC111518650 n=1 Tax=Drosophila willistoni TaxID=7260 RepID=UPI001F07BD26|nr:uncharacterized protein LOC111518650 [Drosophila willistoni]